MNSDSSEAPDWRRHFKQPEPTVYQYFQFLVSEGLGYSKAWKIAYGDYPFEDARQMAEWLRKQGRSYRQISDLVRLKYDKGCPSVIRRWLDSDAYAKHLKQKRKS